MVNITVHALPHYLIEDGRTVGHGKHNWELMKDNIQVISCYLRVILINLNPSKVALNALLSSLNLIN